MNCLEPVVDIDGPRCISPIPAHLPDGVSMAPTGGGHVGRVGKYQAATTKANRTTRMNYFICCSLRALAKPARLLLYPQYPRREKRCS